MSTALRNLLIVATDLVLPGNAGLDIRVQRVYNSAIYPHYSNGGNTTLDEDSWAAVLTEYEARCGTPAWTRDIIYAGARALGAIKAPNTQPTIALTTTASSVATRGRRGAGMYWFP